MRESYLPCPKQQVFRGTEMQDREKKIHTEVCAFCGKAPVYAKGYCKTCYGRYWRNGTPEKVREANNTNAQKIVGEIVGTFQIIAAKNVHPFSKCVCKCIQCGRVVHTTVQAFRKHKICQCEKYPKEFEKFAPTAHRAEIYRELANSDMSMRDLAKKRGCSPTRIHEIVSSIIYSGRMCAKCKQ